MTASEFLEKEGASDDSLNPKDFLGLPRKLTAQEFTTLEEQKEKGFAQDLFEGVGYNISRLANTAADFMEEELGLSAVQGEFEKKTRAFQKDFERRQEIEQQGIVGGNITPGKIAAEMFTYGAPLARLGVVGTGLSAIPKTAAAWGAADAAISASLGYDRARIEDDALLAGLFGGGVGVGARLLSKTAPKPQPQFSKAEQPEVTIDGHFFPDEEIEVIKAVDEAIETARPSTRDVEVSEEVLKESIAKPNKEQHDILLRGEGKEFDLLIEKKVSQEVGLGKLEKDEAGVLTEEARARFKEFKDTVNTILEDPKAKEVYRQQFLNETKQIRVTKEKLIKEPTQEEVVAGQVKAQEAEIKRQEIAKKASKEIREVIETKAPKIKRKKTQAEIKTEKAIKTIKESDSTEFKIADKPTDIIKAGKDEITVGVDEATMTTKRAYRGESIIPERVSAKEYKFAKDRKAEIAKRKDKAEAKSIRIARENREFAYNNGLAFKKSNPNATIRQMEARANAEIKLMPKGIDKKALRQEFIRGMQQGIPEPKIKSKETIKAKPKKDKVTTIKETKVPEHSKEIHAKISEKIGDTKVIIREGLKNAKGEKAKGFYDPDTDTIFIDASAVDTHAPMHEMIHAVIHKAIRKDKKLASEFQELMDEMINVAKKKDGYWTRDLDEFIAEGLSNLKVITFLKNAPYKNTSMWDKFKNLIAKTLGFDISAFGKLNRLFEETINVSPKNKIMKEVDKLDGILRTKVEKSTTSLLNRLGISKEGESITNWRASYETEGAFKTHESIHSKTRDALNQAALAGKQTKSLIKRALEEFGHKLNGKFDKAFAVHVMDTDYSSIREISSMKQANKFLKDNADIYNKAKQYINQTSLGLRDKGAMNHVNFTNNGYAIALRAGIDVKNASVIDKLISVKSMNSEDWRFIESNAGKEHFDTMLNILDRTRAQSFDIFKVSPHNRIKGYSSEIYDSIYRYNMVNGKLVRSVDIEPSIVQGALPQALDKARTGEVIQFPEDMPVRIREDYALSQGLGIILDASSNPVAMRRVASEAQRVKMGKQVYASDVMSLTYENSIRKLTQRDGVVQEIKNLAEETNDLFSTIPTKGMVKLSDAELHLLPKEVQAYVQYVNPSFKHMLVGNKQIQVFKSGILGITEKLMKDTVLHFKENVVLKNPASWANNLAFAFFMNAQAGISPSRSFKLMKKGLKEKSRSAELLRKAYKLEIAKKSNTAEYKAIMKELNSNFYYNLDRQGMGVTVMSNILDTPTRSHRLTDKALRLATNKIFGKEIGDKITTVASNIYISPQAKTGQMAMRLFGDIDAMGRYAMAVDDFAKHGNMDKAIKKSNSVYGDLDMIAPMWSQAIQQYGFIPFSNWFFRVSGGMTKNTRENITKALGVFALLEGMAYISDKRTDSMNPLKTLVSTPVDMFIMSPYNKTENYFKSVVSPAIYKKAIRAAEQGDPVSIAITNDF